MKKIIFLIIIFCVSISDLKAQFVTIQDPNLRDQLMAKYPSCFNGAMEMDISCSSVITEDSLTIFANEVQPVYSYDGIQYFTGLKYLNITYLNNFATLQTNIIPQGLEHFKLTEVDHNLQAYSFNTLLPSSVFPASMRKMEITNSKADFSGYAWPVSLKYLDISFGHATSPGILPASLDTLICNNEGDLIYQPSPSGYTLIADYPTLTSLPVLPAGLKYLDCKRNKLSTLPALPSALQWLDCSNSFDRVSVVGGEIELPYLQNLPALPQSLLFLNCSMNRLTQLPALPASLNYVDCSSNRYYYAYSPYGPNDAYNYPGISNLPLLPSALQYLNCSSNLLIECIPPLPASMSSHSPYNNTVYNLDIRNTSVQCIPNAVPGIRINNYSTLPLCNASNNTNGCATFPRFEGTVFYDYNNNGIMDINEMPKANVRVNINNNNYAFSDLLGHYEVTAVAGSNTLTVDAPPYYNAVPSSFTHTVAGANTTFSDYVALQTNTNVDSLKITITPVNNPRPGFYFAYDIQYENVGTTVLNSDITIDYDNTHLTYNLSSDGAVTDDGTELHLHLSNFSPGQTGRFISNFNVNISTVLATIIRAGATITGGTDVCTDSTFSVVIGSFDPNDKQATPTLTPEQVTAGNYINYLIRFQNTGTASAINIFITDTLSALLQENTVEIIQSSFPCKITQTGNKLLFEFLNINLPDSNSDEPSSHGYVRFRVKPQSALATNTSVENKASIYFDYNAAVVTDPAITTVNYFVVPLSLLDFYGIPDENKNVALFWKTTNEINTASFEIQQANDGRTFSKAASVTASGNGNNQYSKSVKLMSDISYFRLKIYDRDAQFSYSPVIKIKNKNLNAGIVLLGNPVRNELVINIIDKRMLNSTAVIINSGGEIVQSFLVKNDIIHLNVNMLAPGLYTIKTTAGSLKFIISANK